MKNLELDSGPLWPKRLYSPNVKTGRETLGNAQNGRKLTLVNKKNNWEHYQSFMGKNFLAPLFGRGPKSVAKPYKIDWAAEI